MTTKDTSISSKRILSFLWNICKQFPWYLWLALFSRIVWAITALLPAIFYKDIIDLLSTSFQATPEIAIQAIVILSYIGWIKLVTLISSRFTDYFLIELEMRSQHVLYTQAFDYIQGHSLQFFSDNFTGAIIKKISKYTAAFERVLDILVFEIGRFVFSSLIILTVVGMQNIWFAVIFMVGMTCFILIQYKLHLWLQPYQDKANALDSELWGLIADDISNNITIKTFSAARRESQHFAEMSQSVIKARKKWYYKMMWLWLIIGIFTIALEVGLIYLAINFWGKGIITVGTIVLLQTYITRIMEQMRGIGHIFKNFFKSLSEIGETIEILDTPQSVIDHSDKELKILRGDIRFEKIGFSYDRENKVFNDFSLSINAWEKIALVGASGGGKTTIGKLLFRFYDIQSGKILIDGQDIAQVSQESLRKQIGMVPQDPILFHRSIKENIAYGRPDASMEEIIAAAKMARCTDFIDHLPQKFDTLVGERGVKLSGGERQRVAIARAILENSPILVMDEATSALDSESEHLIQEAMDELIKNKTVIIIAHRLSTIMKMDKIFVIEQGKDIEHGTHQELLLKKGAYAKLWDIQSGGFIGE